MSTSVRRLALTALAFAARTGHETADVQCWTTGDIPNCKDAAQSDPDRCVGDTYFQ